jgi:hypothetical protein
VWLQTLPDVMCRSTSGQKQSSRSETWRLELLLEVAGAVLGALALHDLVPQPLPHDLHLRLVEFMLTANFGKTGVFEIKRA